MCDVYNVYVTKKINVIALWCKLIFHNACWPYHWLFQYLCCECMLLAICPSKFNGYEMLLLHAFVVLSLFFLMYAICEAFFSNIHMWSVFVVSLIYQIMIYFLAIYAVHV